jgi:hypothetical protein
MHVYKNKNQYSQINQIPKTTAKLKSHKQQQQYSDVRKRRNQIPKTTAKSKSRKQQQQQQHSDVRKRTVRM